MQHVSVGLDLSITCTGMAVVGDEGGYRGKTVSTKDIKGFTRLHSVAGDIARTIELWQPDIVVVEAYAFVRNVSSFTRLVELGTLVRMHLFLNKIPWVQVPPTSLKLWAVGRGNAKKLEMATVTKQRWGYESTSHDIIDAFCLAQMGQLSLKELQAIRGVTYGA